MWIKDEWDRIESNKFTVPSLYNGGLLRASNYTRWVAAIDVVLHVLEKSVARSVDGGNA